MRIIKEKTLMEYSRQPGLKPAEKALKAWIVEVRYSKWNNSSELKSKYRHAIIISSKRVVFNIMGNKYRLLVDIEYRMKIVFIVWFGTHEDYNNIDAEEIRYES
jgi:mRNA interferase HigB